MKKDIVKFLKSHGHIMVAALCLVIIAIVGISIVGTDENPENSLISYNTPVAIIDKEDSDDAALFDDNDNDSVDASKPIKDDNKAESTEKPKAGQINIIKPLNGEIQTEFAAKKLVFNTTLKEWCVHSGIDIKGEANSDIKAAASGKISAIKNDPKYGLTVVIDHNINNRSFSTIYCGLKSISDNIIEGADIKEGATIGLLGEDIFCEKAQGAHLHFELYENNAPLNPAEYWK